MDRVKLGRALGYGTRHAAKTVAAVVEAAASAPNTPAEPAAARTSPPSPTVIQSAAVRPGARAAAVPAGDLRGRARAVWQPLAVFSGALWLRVTGVFFALIAFTLGNAAWRLRSAFHSGDADLQHRLWLFSAFALLFGYFAVSSFIRANLKERRAAQRV